MRLAPLAVLVLLLALVGCSGSAPAPEGASELGIDAPRSGGRLPDLTLAALDGDGELDLGSVRGPAVVNLWASWCAPCKRELPYYQQFSEQYAGQVDVIGIDFQETREQAARDLVRDSGVTYPVYTDPDGELRAVALPKLVLIDAEGRIALEQYLEIDGPEQLAELVREHLGVTGTTSR